MFATYSGIIIDHANIQPADLNLVDIAHHLTNIGRFGGALDFDLHYSVAEHSILLCEYVLDKYEDVEIAKYALMHDVGEAYLGDVVSGLKRLLPEYKRIENYLDIIIKEKYNLNTYHKELVSSLDKRIVIDESRALCPRNYRYFTKYGPPLGGLGIERCAINDDDYGYFTPGFVPKQTVFEKFLLTCNILGVKDE